MKTKGEKTIFCYGCRKATEMTERRIKMGKMEMGGIRKLETGERTRTIKLRTIKLREGNRWTENKTGGDGVESNH